MKLYFLFEIDNDVIADDTADGISDDLSSLHIRSMDSPERNQENKENQKPWYEGIVHRPVAFRASSRRTSVE